MSEPLLKAGDVIELKDGHRVNADVPQHFLYSNRRGCWDIEHAGVTICPMLEHLRGRYVVINTTVDGGGHSHDGGYPDGHHVWCQHLQLGHRVDFWQTGYFNTLIPDIKPIGRARAVEWEIVADKPEGGE